MAAAADRMKTNPFRPGAGHMPPYLAGRTSEKEAFCRLLEQEVILRNVVLTGLRGVGKTVLLETFKPEATARGWLWIGTDLSETASVDERNLALRMLTDLSVVTAGFAVAEVAELPIGFHRQAERRPVMLDFATLSAIFEQTPGLTSDKLKAVLELVWSRVPAHGKRGIVFAYDESQNLADHSAKDQYPLSLLLDVFQSIQKKGVMFMLVLTGLPTLFPKLVNARTYAERMFTVISLERLNREDSRAAITNPIREHPRKFTPESVEAISDLSGGYPCFIQFVCREVYDIWTQWAGLGSGVAAPPVPAVEIQRKLDTDFFAGRWARVTDRQRELLLVVAQLAGAETEFTVQEIVERSKTALEKPFSNSHVSQMLNSLCESGLVYKNRHGRYSLAVPLLNRFIIRQMKQSGEPGPWGKE